MNNKTKLVILSAFYEPYMSGAEQMVRVIAEKLGSKYDITIITGRYDRRLARFECRRHFKLARVGFGFKRLDKFFYPIWAAWAVFLFKPHITHAVMESYAGLALVLTKWTYPKTKRILTLQSGDLDDKDKQTRFYINWVWKLIHRSPDMVTAISNSLAKRAEALGVAKDKIAITPNGIDFDEVPSGIQAQKNRVIIVARLSWAKDHASLLKAWPVVIAKFPDAKLAIVGEGEDRDNIEKLIADLGLGTSVEMLGFLPHDEALVEIKKSAVFVCPSLAEGLGNVFIEAQACGVPPIGTRVGGIPDIIEDVENGLLVEVKNPEAIANAIISLLSDEALRNKIISKGLETSRQFSWDIILADMEKIYSKLLK
jgi:glycosyltransferase involved in cell wall biosynthesis